MNKLAFYVPFFITPPPHHQKSILQNIHPCPLPGNWAIGVRYFPKAFFPSGNLWEVSTWKIAHLGSCHLGKCLNTILEINDVGTSVGNLGDI